jgi:hypothetical protein
MVDAYLGSFERVWAQARAYHLQLRLLPVEAVQDAL